jgi:hypothetical protein
MSPADWPLLAAGKLDLIDNFAACFDKSEQAILPPFAAGKLDLDKDFFHS